MNRDELTAEIAGCLAAFRGARDRVEETERRLAKAFAEADEDDQLWFVGEVMTVLGALVKETEGRQPAIANALTAAMRETGRVH